MARTGLSGRLGQENAMRNPSRTAQTAAALTIGEATPDAKAFVVLKCVLKALIADGARLADALCLTGRATLLREESFWVRLRAQRLVLPFLLDGAKKFVEGHSARGRAAENGVVNHVFHAIPFLVSVFLALGALLALPVVGGVVTYTIVIRPSGPT